MATNMAAPMRSLLRTVYNLPRRSRLGAQRTLFRTGAPCAFCRLTHHSETAVFPRGALSVCQILLTELRQIILKVTI